MTQRMASVDRVDYDAELQRHNEVLRRGWGIRPQDRVLDVGCGAGQTTRDAARLAKSGSALGVDISTSMIERARELAKAEGLRNVAFVQGDASVHKFPPDEFDIVISRFGTMFFADPVAAFANLARSLRHSGRLMMMVWQDAERNEWTRRSSGRSR
jgi:ubiquinone/menaquinone biosynthesis C-methylase UbiE